MPKSIQNKNKSYVHFGIYALKKRVNASSTNTTTC